MPPPSESHLAGLVGVSSRAFGGGAEHFLDHHDVGSAALLQQVCEPGTDRAQLAGAASALLPRAGSAPVAGSATGQPDERKQQQQAGQAPGKLPRWHHT